jgi:hypothetical protein
MRRLIASTFASLDGTMQAPGGPEEDPTGGLAPGGWTFSYFDDSVDISTSGYDRRRRDEHLCSRRRNPCRFVRERRAEREGAGPTRRDGERDVVTVEITTHDHRLEGCVR